MTDLAATQFDEPATDGRVARRQRNIASVLDVVLEMFGEDSMFPTMEQVAKRSGLSLRSLYRYFADPGELLEAAIKHSAALGAELSRLPGVGEGPIEQRIDDFVGMRIRLYEGIAPIFRATIANAERHPRILEERAKNRNLMREQFERQFAPELAAMAKGNRQAVITGGDLATQLESLDYLMRHRGLGPDEVRKALVANLRALLV